MITIEARLVGADGSRSAIKAIETDQYLGYHVFEFEWAEKPGKRGKKLTFLESMRRKPEIVVIGVEHRCLTVMPAWKYIGFDYQRGLFAGDAFTANILLNLVWER